MPPHFEPLKTVGSPQPQSPHVAVQLEATIDTRCLYLCTDLSMPVAMDTFTCNSCEQEIPVLRARLRCLACSDYDSCADCHVTKPSTRAHSSNHKFEVYMRGIKLDVDAKRESPPSPPKAPLQKQNYTRASGATTSDTASRVSAEPYWGMLITSGKTPSPILSRLIAAIFEHFASDSAEVLQPNEFCSLMMAAGRSAADFPPLQIPMDESASAADLHRLDAWLSNWYQSFPLDHRTTTREFAPPPPVQPHNGRIRFRDQLLHAVLHPTAPIAPDGLPLLSRQGFEQYLMSLAMEDPSDLSTRLNNILLALSPLTDGETGRPFDARPIPRTCLPSSPDPQVMRARMLEKQEKEREQQEQEMARRHRAEEAARERQEQQMALQQQTQQIALQQQQAQQIAFQQQQAQWMAFQGQQAQQMASQGQQAQQAALQRMRNNHIVNMNAAEARANCVGGWRVDAYGNKVYHPGYF